MFLSPSQRCWLLSCLKRKQLLDSARGLTADRVHVIYSSRFVGRYDQFLGIQADPNRLYVAYTRGRLATAVWMEREPLGCPDEECWEGWMPTFNNHPAKSASSRTTQQGIQFAARRLALLHRGEVAEPAGSAHSAPTEFHHRRHRRHRRHRKNLSVNGSPTDPNISSGMHAEVL